MADQPAFESPIVATYERRPGADLVLADRSAATKVLVRAGADTAAAAALGVGFGSSRRVDDVMVVGPRPTEWLVVGETAAVAALVAGLDRAGHVSVVDHTHARAMFRLTGARAPDTLAKICNVDWSDPMTPDGAALSASIARVNADIVRDDVDGVRSYQIAADRSFAQYLFDAILDAGDEFAIAADV